MAEPDKPIDDPALRARMAELKAEIDAASSRREDGAEAASKTGDSKAVGLGLRIGSELIAGVLVGTGIGYFIDRALSSSPLFLIIFLMLGTAASVVNIYRLSRQTDAGQGGEGRKK